MSRLLAVAVTPLAVGSSWFAGTATADPDDQAAAEAAVAVFNQRLTDAGWTSTGPIAASEPIEPGEGEFGDCLGGFEVYFDNTELQIDDATARAFSDQFFLMPSDPDSTDSMGESGNAGAVVLTVADSAVGILDAFVARLGAEETAACIAEQPAYQSLSEEDSTVDSTITNESDLSVGDTSARLDVRLVSNYEGSELSFFATFVVARVDSSLVLVAIGGSGRAEVDVDPVAELAAMVDALR
jgi:hypothetical protein